MPVADPRAGRALVWTVSCFILLSLAFGGAFLVMYMMHPDPTTSSWMLYVGMTFVCMPWTLWIMLCVYRCVSRSLGVRIVCCGGIDGAPSNRGGAGSASMNRAASLVGTNNAGIVDIGNGDGKQMNFGAEVVVDEANGNHNRASSSSSSSNNDVSRRSRESEIAFASAMAS